MSSLGYKYVVAFADPEAGEIGTIYQATNWYYLGFTKDIHHDLYYKSGKVFMNDRDTAKKLGFRGVGKLREYISDKPWLEIRKRKPKGRYMSLIGTKKENKEMGSVLLPHVKAYPKRST
jgi:hypothetical protein